MRYWLYKCNIEGGPAGYAGDWRNGVFRSEGATEWGGHYSTASPEVARLLDDFVNVGDVVVAYQTNEKAIVGFCRIDDIEGKPGDLKVVLQPIHELAEPFLIHQHKKGTVLERSSAVQGPVMLRELERSEMEELVRLSGAPRFVLKGADPPGGWKPLRPGRRRRIRA